MKRAAGRALLLLLHSLGWVARGITWTCYIVHAYLIHKISEAERWVELNMLDA